MMFSVLYPLMSFPTFGVKRHLRRLSFQFLVLCFRTAFETISTSFRHPFLKEFVFPELGFKRFKVYTETAIFYLVYRLPSISDPVWTAVSARGVRGYFKFLFLYQFLM